MNEMLIFWLVLLILCIVIEVLTLGLTTIWFAGGALIAIFASLLYAPIFVQIILFFAVSLAMLFFTRPIAVKYFNKDRVKTNVESMVGRQAIVTGEIDNVKATGQVTVNGQEWTARSWDDRVKIPEGAIVTVRAINGVKLIVEPGENSGRRVPGDAGEAGGKEDMNRTNVQQAQAPGARTADERTEAGMKRETLQEGENRGPQAADDSEGAARETEIQKKETDAQGTETTGSDGVSE